MTRVHKKPSQCPAQPSECLAQPSECLTSPLLSKPSIIEQTTFSTYFDGSRRNLNNIGRLFIPREYLSSFKNKVYLYYLICVSIRITQGLSANANVQRSTLSGQHQNGQFSQISDLTVNHYVFAEILRLFPPLPFLDRECTVPYRVPGTELTIERGTYVYVPVMGIQTDAKYFPEPLAFRPERFHKENGDGITPFTFFPFGEGPRNCIGWSNLYTF